MFSSLQSNMILFITHLYKAFPYRKYKKDKYLSFPTNFVKMITAMSILAYMYSQYCLLQTFCFVKNILEHSPKKCFEIEGSLTNSY